MATRDQMRKGSTEILILNLLAERPMYGYEIGQQLFQRSDGYFEMKEGLLYPTLHRMQQNGLLLSEWRVIEGRRRKYYLLTPHGHQLLNEQAAEWNSFLAALQRMLHTHPQWND